MWCVACVCVYVRVWCEWCGVCVCVPYPPREPVSQDDWVVCGVCGVRAVCVSMVCGVRVWCVLCVVRAVCADWSQQLIACIYGM